MKSLIKFIFIPYLILLFVISFSVIKSGLFYQYDIDELGHAGYTYLLMTGYTPYRDFHMIFSPIFYWLQMPIFLLSGFNFQSIFILRVIMVILFALRILVSFLFVKNIFGKKIASLFVLIFLLDPFSNFSSMQIRPDNVMMLLFMSSLYLLERHISLRKKIYILLSSIFLGTSILVLLKILPAVILVLGFVFYIFLSEKDKRGIFLYLGGFILPFILLSIYLLLNNLFVPYLYSTLVGAWVNNRVVVNQTPISFFFREDNIFIFGEMGRPVLWAYIRVMLALFPFGVIVFISHFIKHGKINIDYKNSINVLILLISIIFTLWITIVPGLFLQYFIPVSWTYSLFISVLIVYALEFIYKRNRKVGMALCIILSLIFISMILKSAHSYEIRSSFDSKQTISEYEKRWELIKKNESSFPNTLFRPISYPLSFGTFIGDVHPSILSKWGTIEKYLSMKKTKYVFKDDYLWGFLNLSTKRYIEENYEEPPEKGILIRKNGV